MAINQIVEISGESHTIVAESIISGTKPTPARLRLLRNISLREAFNQVESGDPAKHSYSIEVQYWNGSTMLLQPFIGLEAAAKALSEEVVRMFDKIRRGIA